MRQEPGLQDEATSVISRDQLLGQMTWDNVQTGVSRLGELQKVDDAGHVVDADGVHAAVGKSLDGKAVTLYAEEAFICAEQELVHVSFDPANLLLDVACDGA
jgi:flavin-dependent dehydrogenase